MNLTEWAKQRGGHPVTAYRWFREGKLRVRARRVGGLILVGQPSGSPAGQVAVYARVSSEDQRAGLDRQVARVTAWFTSQGVRVDRLVTEIGSALDGRGEKLFGLLRDAAVVTVVVEHRDRFARFGAEYVEAALAAQGRRLLVVDPSEVDDDLVRDGTEIVTSLCARLYAPRAAANRAKRAVEAVTKGGGRNGGPYDPVTGRRRPASHRWTRATGALASAHRRVADLRRDGIHQLTTRLPRQYGTVVVEDLNVAGMLRNRRLARAICDVGFGQIRRQLDYKTRWNGGRLVVADRWWDVNAARNLAALAARIDDAPSGGESLNGRGADRKARCGGQVAVKRQPRTGPPGKTGTAAPQGAASKRGLTKAH